MWTVERALRQYKDWQAREIDLEIAVNLSMWDLHDPTFPARIATLFGRYDVPPDRIRMEVTESAAMSDPDLTINVLKRLSALGIHCSLDDFGTGYSSLTYIKRLPIDELKIDRSFIQHITDTPADEAIVSSTITLAHSLGLHVVAEGVEDAHTMELLDTLGCDIAQGYYLSRPLPPEGFVGWLQKREHSLAA
jgi:EAL domain-containing protein (putative c-di-GMP-specific phosphodiesterase class I)